MGGVGKNATDYNSGQGGEIAIDNPTATPNGVTKQDKHKWGMSREVAESSTTWSSHNGIAEYTGMGK